MRNTSIATSNRRDDWDSQNHAKLSEGAKAVGCNMLITAKAVYPSTFISTVAVTPLTVATGTRTPAIVRPEQQDLFVI